MIWTDKILHINKDYTYRSNPFNRFDQCTIILYRRWKFVVHPVVGYA